MKVDARFHIHILFFAKANKIEGDRERKRESGLDNIFLLGAIF